jgi:hypothetical protein
MQGSGDQLSTRSHVFREPDQWSRNVAPALFIENILAASFKAVEPGLRVAATLKSDTKSVMPVALVPPGSRQCAPEALLVSAVDDGIGPASAKRAMASPNPLPR